MLSEAEKVSSKTEALPFKVKVCMLLRWDLRTLFGEGSYSECGKFVDYKMTRIVHDYCDETKKTSEKYPKGDQVFKEHKNWITDAVITKDGTRLFTVSVDQTIKCWDLLNIALKTSKKAHLRSKMLCVDHHNSGLLVTGAEDSSLKLWNDESLKLLHFLDGHNNHVTSAAFTKNGQFVVSSSKDRTLRVWLCESGECTKVLSEHTGQVKSVIATMFNDDAHQRVLSVSEDKSVKLWNLSLTDIICETTHIDIIEDPLYDSAINCDASLLTLVTRRTTVVFNWPDMSKLMTLEELNMCAAFHPSDARMMAVGNRDYTVNMYDVFKSECVYSFKGHTRLVRALCFTPDGTRLVSCSDDSTARMWDLSVIG